MDPLPRPINISIYALADFIVGLRRENFMGGSYVGITSLYEYVVCQRQDFYGIILFPLGSEGSVLASDNFYDIAREITRLIEAGVFERIENKLNHYNDEQIEFIFDDRLRDDYFFLETLIKNSALCDMSGKIIGDNCTVSLYMHGTYPQEVVARITGTLFTIDDAPIGIDYLAEIIASETPLVRRQKIALDYLKLKPQPVLLQGKKI